MTTINNQDDFLAALRSNPRWRGAVPVQIPGEDLMQLAATFDTFLEAQPTQNQRFDRFTEEHRTSHANMAPG